MQYRMFFTMYLLFFFGYSVFAETTESREVRFFSNTDTPTRWTVGEVRLFDDGHDGGYRYDYRPSYGGRVEIGRQNGHTRTDVGFYFNNTAHQDEYSDDPPYGHYRQGYRDGFRDGTNRNRPYYQPYIENSTTVVFDGAKDRYECRLTLYGMTYIARAPFSDIAQNRVYENCAAGSHDIVACRRVQTRCESIW